MKTYRLIGAILLCLTAPLHSQELPSWQKEYEQIQHLSDSLFVARQYDEALILVEQFLHNHQDHILTYPAILYDVYFRKGVFLSAKNQYQQAISWLTKSLEQVKLTGDSAEIAHCLAQLGNNHVYLGQYQEAVEVYNQALDIYQQIQDQTSISMVFNSMGKVYELWRDFDQALIFFHKSLDISLSIQNHNQAAIRMASIGSVHKNIGQFDDALHWLYNSLELEKQLQNKVRIAFRMDQLGEVYTLMGNYSKAERYLLEALAIFEELAVLNSQAIALNHLAFNSMKKNNLDEALRYYNRSLEIARNNRFHNMLQKNLLELTDVFSRKGDFASALEHYREYVALRDSAFNENARKQLAEFQVKYETEQKEKELALVTQEKLLSELNLQKARQRQTLMIGMVLILLSTLAGLYSRFLIKKRTQQELALVNLKLSELNSTKDKLFSIVAHDLKNATVGFSRMAETLTLRFDSLPQENMKQYLSELTHSAHTLRNMLKNLLQWARSQQNSINIKPEDIPLRQVAEDLIQEASPVALRKTLAIENNIGSDLKVCSDLNIVSTIMRNLISNAIKYSFEGGVVTLSAQPNGSGLVIGIEDQGTGMTAEEIRKILESKGNITSSVSPDGEKGTGLGLMLSMELLEKIGGSLQISSQKAKGSCFKITIPCKQNR
ncbi:MAG: tetratricopeptide repeat protein [Bacteroidales bacterium]